MGNSSNDDELEVANILLDLPYLMTKSLSDYRFANNWGSKRLRSALIAPPSPPPRTRRKTPPSPVEVVVGVKREAASPTTPLSFPPSDSSDSKPKKKSRLNLRNEELERAVDEKLQTRQQLNESIEKVQVYLNNLRAENSELKAKKQELKLNMGENKLKAMTASTSSTSTTEQQREEPSTVNAHAMVRVNDQLHAVPSSSTASYHLTPLMPPYHQIYGVNDLHQHHQQQQQQQQAAVLVGFQHQPPLISYHDHHHHHQRQHHILIDLNELPEEADTERSRAQEARMHRYRVNKEKKTRGRP